MRHWPRGQEHEAWQYVVSQGGLSSIFTLLQSCCRIVWARPSTTPFLPRLFPFWICIDMHGRGGKSHSLKSAPPGLICAESLVFQGRPACARSWCRQRWGSALQETEANGHMGMLGMVHSTYWLLDGQSSALLGEERDKTSKPAVRLLPGLLQWVKFFH